MLPDHRYLHHFLTLKYNELQARTAPSPAGEGWGEENKIKAFLTPLIQPSPAGEGF